MASETVVFTVQASSGSPASVRSNVSAAVEVDRASDSVATRLAWGALLEAPWVMVVVLPLLVADVSV